MNTSTNASPRQNILKVPPAPAPSHSSADAPPTPTTAQGSTWVR